MGDKQYNQLRSEGVSIPNMTYYFISGSLPDNYGGLTKSLLLRSKLFGAESHVPTAFLTFRFDKEFSSKKDQLFENQKIDRKYTRVINMFHDYLSKNANGRLYSERLSLQEIKKQARKNQFLEKFGKIFGRRINTLNITLYEDGQSICFVDYFNHEKKRYKREEYNKEGTLCLVSYFDTKTERMYRQEFINEENTVYLDKHYEFNSEKNDIQFIHMNWYSKNGVLQFSDESDVRRHWIEALQAESDQPKLFLVDSRPQDKHIFRVKKAPSSYYAAIIHNKHYGNNKYQIKGRYMEVFSQMPNLDAVFFITEEQMGDFELISGKQEIFFYTPHTIAKPLDPEVLNVPSEKNKAVIISRLASMKNLTHAVKAFKLVVNEIPEAKLEIYGSGEDEGKIKAEIEACDLQKNVFLKGYTENPDAEFQKAWLTISTSHFEGFGLSNMEALSNGCPVVTYDYDYGARSLVNDNENGFVVEQYNIEQLAEKIILLMKNEQLHEAFSKRAFETAEKYSVKNYMLNWSVALQSMIRIKEERQKLAKTFSSKQPFTVKELQTNESKLAIELQAPMPIDEDFHVKLIGLDRKNKAVVVSAAPEKAVSDQAVRFNIEDQHIHVDKMRANKTKTLDFYVEISNADYIKVLKRLSVDQAEMASPFSSEEYKVVPYTTVKGNYSWTIKAETEISS